MRRFADRQDAGRVLGRALVELRDAAEPDERSGWLVLGLPRGGVVVAAEVARLLHAPLDVVVVRKLGVPGQEELAFGAVSADGERVLNADVVRAARLTDRVIEEVTAREVALARRRVSRYRGSSSATSWRGRRVVVVDDGVATGATLHAALQVVVQAAPSRLVVAVPVGPPALRERLPVEVDDVVVLEQPRDFVAVGQVYEHFDEVSDDEVARCLWEAAG